MNVTAEPPKFANIEEKIIADFSGQNQLIGSEFKLFGFDYWNPISLITEAKNIRDGDGYYPASIWEMLYFLSKNPIGYPIVANGSLSYCTANLVSRVRWPDGHTNTLSSKRIAIRCVLYCPKDETITQVSYSYLLEGLYGKKSEIMSLGVRRNTDTCLFLHHPMGDINLDEPGSEVPPIFIN